MCACVGTRVGMILLGDQLLWLFASRLPAKKVNLDDLLLYFISVLDPIVRDDYVLVYVASDITSANRPPFSWLRRAYSLFSRKYKKHIQKLYIIHPTTFTKLMMKLMKPLISEKFHKKLVVVENISQMLQFISPDQLRLPESCYAVTLRKGQQYTLFGVTLEVAAQQCPHASGIAKPIYQVMRHLYRHGLTEEGLFRVSGSEAVVRQLATSMEDGQDLVFDGVDIHAVSGVLKLFIRELRTTPFPATSFPILSAAMTKTEDMWILDVADHLSNLSQASQHFLRHLMHLFAVVQIGNAVNKMTAQNLAISIGPYILTTGNSAQALRDASVQGAIVKRLVETWTLIVEANPAMLVQKPFEAE